MILFFGTKRGKQTSKRLPNTNCNHCAQTDTLTAISQPNYFHLFWIPLFKIGTSHYVECSHCKKVYYKEDFTEDIAKALNQP